MTSIQEVVKQFKPLSDPVLAKQTLLQHWPVWCNSDTDDDNTEEASTSAKIVVKVLDSYDDANFYISVSNNDHKAKGLLKFYNATYTNPDVLTVFTKTTTAADTGDILEGLSLMLNTLTVKLATHQLSVPSIILPTQGCEQGKDLIMWPSCPLANQSTASVAVRLFTWIEGDTLSHYLSTLSLASSGNTQLPHVLDLFLQVGRSIGLMYHALDGLTHPSFHREHIWDIKQFELVQSLRQYLPSTDSSMPLSDIVEKVFNKFEDLKSRLSDKLPHSVIMGDANDANIIVHDGKVVGLIDFSDAIYTWTVSELSIAMAYALISAASTSYSIEIISALLLGYMQHRTLPQEELECLPVLMAVRLSASVMVGAYSIFKEPDNDYLTLHAVPGRKSLTFWTAQPWETHTQYFADLQKEAQQLWNVDKNVALTSCHIIDMIDALKHKHYSS